MRNMKSRNFQTRRAVKEALVVVERRPEIVRVIRFRVGGWLRITVKNGAMLRCHGAQVKAIDDAGDYLVLSLKANRLPWLEVRDNHPAVRSAEAALKSPRRRAR